jgi:superfamily I DNA and/or RNA helicase
MNLFHLNTGVESRVLQNADYDIRRYTDFINRSIEFLKRETLAIKVTKSVVGEEVRYYPEAPSSKRVEKAIEQLFSENTKSVFDQIRSFHFFDSVRIVDRNEDENYIILEAEIQGDIIYLKPDTYQLEQQKRTLDNLRFRPLKEHQALLNLFGYPDSRVWQQNHYTKDFPWKILTNEDADGVYEQREFVSKAVQTNDFALLEGPPGSGKTTTIIELIMQYAAEGKRILLCSATHAAIDNVIERIKGKYRNICDREIIPVRISRFDGPVKESVRPYLLQNLVETYKRDIKRHLGKNQKLKCQKYLLENLHKDDQSDVDPIEKIILDSANLVAGTMIGILQHPDIRANRQGASFDVLIVDEASKVTFSDFIVPALHARKWILVGDVKQLSPYVENDYVSENISKMIDAESQRAIVRQFELKAKLDDSRYEDCLKVYFTDHDPNGELEFLDGKELFVETIKVDWEASEVNIARLNSADVVIAKNVGRVRDLLSDCIHVKSIFINGEPRGVEQRYRQDYFRGAYRKPLSYLFDSRQEDWSEMVSSRLNQSFSFRKAEGFENIDRELDYLIPAAIRDEINQIRRLVFPSILELLQNGIGKGQGQRVNRVLSEGFHPYYKQSRFVSLTYQHRMHPDIAKTSRDNFYDNNLQSANTVLNERDWKYAPGEPMVKWIFNNDKTANRRGGQIVNPTEAGHIMDELVKFLEWARHHPKSNGHNYEVAVLTFYLNQEFELRTRIRGITKQGAFSKFHKDNTDIFLYTVDKFQGQEADMVLLGFTKFTRDAHFNSPNRLNVALTRARHKLILFGNRPWFKERAKLKALRDLASNFDSTIRMEG